MAEKLDNVKFICADAALLPVLFEENAFETIYINFCDPWPKARHAKRRLTSEGYLLLFKRILCDDGKIEFKTDNAGLFEFSLEEFPKASFDIKNITRDLHASEFAKENIQTEYERNFSAKGFKINRLEAYKNNSLDCRFFYICGDFKTIIQNFLYIKKKILGFPLQPQNRQKLEA